MPDFNFEALNTAGSRNTGTLTASLTGALGSAYAVVDKAGSIVSVTNTNTILADLVPASVAHPEAA